MSPLSVSIAHTTIMLDPAGVMIIPNSDMAIVSDLHLGKGSYFAKTGQLLPPYDSEETLKRLIAALDRYTINTVVLLGDSVHDSDAWARLTEREHQLFQQLTERYDLIWILGNHEKGFIPKGVHACTDYLAAPFLLRHEAEEDIPDDLAEITGHYHPKAVLSVRRTKMRKPCFLVGADRIMMPAFGSFTGGLSALDPAILNWFPDGFTAYLTGERIVAVPKTALSP